MRPRTTVARRALWVALLLGGFLALAFVCGGKAHADTPGNQPARPAATTLPGAATLPDRPLTADQAAGNVAGQATRDVNSSADRAGSGVRGTVAAATRTARPLNGLAGSVRATAGRVTAPVVRVIGDVNAGHHGSGHGGAATSGGTVRHRGAGRPGVVRGGAFASQVSGPQAYDVMAHGAAHPFPLAGSKAAPQQAPGHAPAPSDRSGHPVEGDGAAHHTGDGHADLFGCGVRFPLNAAAPGAAHGPAPLRRASDVSVQPD
ncbi:hypothetical protein K7472_03460 [Streptomyces sp. PTM05]|uniref:Uncharacterized protein n=1 Tax=Streptantibioticus parmotrematis TaxID=2873249 RepID=A0ABS7QL43_9ACTN|nr:hypothetical protein [Streptantibioticus parmotrematis]MBY8883898.1 hypothetical protein [Streptantibioticus parmotrematis]